MNKTIAAALAAASLLATFNADARKKNETLLESVAHAYQANHSYEVPATGSVEVAFSPEEGSEALIIRVIESARSELRVLAYSFTSAPVTSALLRAKKRGVDVRLVADQKSNESEDRSGKARAALSALANAGVNVRLVGVYPIHHDFRGFSNS